MPRLLPSLALSALLLAARAAPLTSAIGPHEAPDAAAQIRAAYTAIVRDAALQEVLRQEDDVPSPSGFTMEVNDGTDDFMPILPGTSVPAANEFDDDMMPVVTDPVDPSAPPLPVVPPPVAPGDGESPEPIASDRPLAPGETLPPIATPIFVVGVSDSPVPSPFVDPPTPTDIFPIVFPTDEETIPSTVGPSISPSLALSPDPSPTMEVTPTPDATDITFPDITITPDADAAGEDDDESACFPASATVEMEDGTLKTMDQVVLGDRVRVADGLFSEVFMFTHKLANIRHAFLDVRTDSGNDLTLTKGHYLYVNGNMAAAETIRVGHTLQLADGSLTTVTAVANVKSTGLFNPQTLHGDVIVNGIRASTYTTTVQPGLAHALLAPVRAAFAGLGLSMVSLESGANCIANVMPSGSLIA